MAQIISPFIKYCSTIGVVPSTYEENLTYIECLNYLIKFLNDTVIPAFNENDAAFAALKVDYAQFKQDLTEEFNTLKTFVEDYFENLDVQEEINNKLDEMAESGELRNAMQPYFDYLANKVKSGYTISTLPLVRLCRSIHNKTDDDYVWLQGGCYTENGKAIRAMLQGENNIKLVEFELSTGNVIRESAALNIGHANGLAYDSKNGLIYATGLTGTYAKNLYIVNYDDFTYEGVATLDIPDGYGTSGIAIDPVTGKSYLSIELSASPNSLRLYEINLSDYSLTEITVEDNFNYLGTTANNAIAAKDGVVYFTKYDPAMIIAVNVGDGKISNIYNIPNVTGQGYWTRDAQFLSFVSDGNEGEIIIGTTGDDSRNGEYRINQFFRSDLYAGASNDNRFEADTTSYTVYVDLTTTNNNPNGTNARPFKTLGEALDTSMLHKSVNYVLIGTTDTIYPKVEIGPRHNSINVYSQSARCNVNGIVSYSVHPASFTNIAIAEGATITLASVVPTRVSLNNVIVPSNDGYNISISNTELSISNMTNQCVYNINCNGELNTFMGTTIGNMGRIHFGGTGRITLLTPKTCGQVQLSSTSTSANSIDLSLDTTVLNDGQHQIEYRSYVNYSRSLGYINIPSAGGSAIAQICNNARLITMELHRTNDNKFYATITKAFTIGADGSLTDSTSTTSGTLDIALVQNI